LRSACCRDDTTTNASANVYHAGKAQKTAMAPIATIQASARYARL
jgi:hypothetical protein